MSEPLWSKNVLVQLEWRSNEENPKFPDITDQVPTGPALYLNSLYIGYVYRRNNGWYSYRFTADISEKCITYFPTEQEAKDHLVDTTLKGLNP